MRRASVLFWAVYLAHLCAGVMGLDAPLYEYHDHAALTLFLNDVVAEYPDITHLKSIGKTVNNRDLWVLTISSFPATRPTLVPDLNVIGNMHGNEVVGREVLIHFIHYLVTSYASDGRVQALLQSSRVQILVSMNPDGFSQALKTCTGTMGRSNGNGFDLNRNFPDYFTGNEEERQPETLAVMQWAAENHFLIHVNLHGGAMVVNYPYDNYIGGMSPTESSAPAHVSMTRDNDVFRYMSMEYSYANPRMPTITMCVLPAYNSTNEYEDGITNGADWYPTRGCMQDWFYTTVGAMAVTVELSCCKYPQDDQLERYYTENRDSLIKYLETSYKGVRGLVSDEEGMPLSGVLVTIVGRDHPRETSDLGEYWRILLPGTYTLRFSRSCYETREVTVQVPGTGHERKDVVLNRMVASGSPGIAQPHVLLVVAACLLLYTQLVSLTQTDH